jgi:hypothetical protein
MKQKNASDSHVLQGRREVDQHRRRISIRHSLSSLCVWSLWENYLREPRSDTLREGFKVTDGITLFDEFEKLSNFFIR